MILLTCSSAAQAQQITEKLLAERLVACVKQWPVTASFIWNDQIDNTQELILMMETIEEKFGAVEKVVKELHNYELPVLTAFPLVKVSRGVEEWIKESVKQDR